MSINVSYIKNPNESTGKIKINQTTVDTSTFNTIHGVNNNDVDFTKEQKVLRCLDMMKDGSVSKATNIAKSVPELLNMNKDIKYATLHTWEDHMTERNKDRITPKTWTKAKYETYLSPMLENRVVFKESGLGSEYFITPEIKYVGNIATEVIDPAGRSAIEPKDIRFPENNQTLVLDKSFLELFGFEDCSVTSTRSPSGAYNYTISIGGAIVNKTKVDPITINKAITNEVSADPKKRLNIDWFQGNVSKNNFIGLNNLASTRIKRGLLITKEMGDVLQVLIMFIWHKLNEKKLYSIVTCDKVVALLCMILEVNCIITSADEEEEAGEEEDKKSKKSKASANSKKLRRIDIYEVNVNPLDKAKIRFNSLKESILKDNGATIAAIKEFRDKNPFIKGNFNDAQLGNVFYDKIIGDLTKINDILRNDITNTLENEAAIDKLCKDINANFVFKPFFRANNAKRGSDKKRKEALNLDTTQKKYTEKNDMWKNKLNPSTGSYKYGETAFYVLGIYNHQKRQGYLLSQPAQPASVAKSAPGVSVPKPMFSKPQKSVEPPPPPENKMEVVEDEGPTPIYWKQESPTPIYWKQETPLPMQGGNQGSLLHILGYPDEAPFYDKDTDMTYNLYDELERQTEEHLNRVQALHYYNEIYNELLHQFYLNDYVMYDQELTGFIDKLLAEYKRDQEVVHRMSVSHAQMSQKMALTDQQKPYKSVQMKRDTRKDIRKMQRKHGRNLTRKERHALEEKQRTREFLQKRNELRGQQRSESIAQRRNIFHFN